MSVALSFRTEESIREQLDKIADALDRNRNWVINEAIENYLDLYSWQLEHIEEGIRDTRAGRTHTPEEVRDHFKKRYVDSKRKSKK